jgi:hypothetical protein
VNARYPSAESQVRDVREAARALTLKIHVLPAGTDGEIDAAFETVARERIPAIVVAGGAAALSGSRISRLGSQISLTGCHVDRNRHMLVHD